MGLVLVLAPLAFGAVHPWSFYPLGLLLLAVSAAVLLRGLYLLGTGAGQCLLPRPPLWGLAAAGILLVALQTVPLPQGLVGWLSPAALEVRAAGRGFGLAPFLPLSLNPYATRLECYKAWPAVALFYLLVFTVNSRRQLLTLTGLLLGLALVEVLYGFWHFHSHTIWGWRNPYGGGRLCGTFINADHLAAYVNPAILLGFGLFQGLRERAPALDARFAGRRRWQAWSQAEHLEPRLQRLLLLLLLVFLTVGVIFTGSRGGMLSLVAGLATMGLLVLDRRWRQSLLVLLLSFLGFSVLYSLCLGSAPLLVRFLDVQDPVRAAAFAGAWAIFLEYPWLGSGLGTFGDLFYRLEPPQFQGARFLQVHSDWLQTLAETGLAGFLLLAAAWGCFFAGLLRQWRRRRDPWARGLGLGGLGALVAGALHAVLDFPFHIPGLTLTYAAVAALTFLAVYHHRPFDQFSYPAWKFPGSRPWCALALAGLLALHLALGFQMYSWWQAERAAPTEPDSTRLQPVPDLAALRLAASLNPHNSHYIANLAMGLDGQPPEAEQRAETAKLWRQAILQAPADWRHRLGLAEWALKHYRDDPARHLPLALEELNAAVRLFPQAAALHWRLGGVLAWMEKHYCHLVPLAFRGRAGLHLEEARRLDRRLQQCMPPHLH